MLRRHCRVCDARSTTSPLKKQKIYFCPSGSLFLGGCSHKQQQQCGVVVPIIFNAAFWTVEDKSCWWEHSHVDQGRRTVSLITINFTRSIYFQQKILFFPLSWSFDCTLHRRRFPSPWCGLQGAAATQKAEKSSVNFSGRLSQENQRSILSLPAWGHGIAPWTKKAWCMTIIIRYCVILRLKKLEKVSFSFKQILLLSFPQFKGKGCWVHWNESIKSVVLGDKNTKIQDIIVPTIDTVRYNFLMDIHVNNGVSVFQNSRS